MNQQQPGNSSSRRFSLSRPSPAEGLVIRRTQEALANQPPQPLPAPTGKPPYHVSLDEVLTPAQMQAMRASGQLVFPIAGDTGGVKAPQAQEIVMMHMENDLTVTEATAQPAFFYHLGDVVYYYGQASEYYSQFYEPNVHYTAPIFAIPGNHDGDLLDTSVPSLAAFVENFCAPEPHLTAEAGDSGRDAMTQPLNPLLYQHYAQLAQANALRDVTSGHNGGYSAGPGWDACTGLGTPDGAKLLVALSA